MLRLERHLERWRVGYLALVLAAFGAALVRNAIIRPLFYDELFTYSIARLDSVATIWRALRAGAENHAPLDYIIRHFALAALGDSELTVRLPGILALLATAAMLFRLTRRWTGTLCGLIAVMVFACGIDPYTENARPYPTLLAVYAGVLLAWEHVARRREARGLRRTLSLGLLALLCATAFLVHYYGVFVVIPPACAEIVRSFRRRRVDLPVWGAFLCVFAPLPLLWPLIQAARSYSSHFWGKVELSYVGLTYAYFGLRTLIPLALTLACGLLFFLLTRDKRVLIPRLRGNLLVPLAAAAGLLALPWPLYLAGVLVTHAIAAHYVSAWIIGAGLLSAIFVRRSPFARWTAALTGIPWFLIMMSGLASFITPAPTAEIRHSASLLAAASARTGLPVVVPDSHVYMELRHYSAPAAAGVFVHPTDRNRAARLIGFDTDELALVNLSPWAGLNVPPCDSFLRAHREFLLYRTFRGVVPKDWLTPTLLASGARLTRLDANEELFRVTLSGTKRW